MAALALPGATRRPLAGVRLPLVGAVVEYVAGQAGGDTACLRLAEPRMAREALPLGGNIHDGLLGLALRGRQLGGS